MHENWTGRVSKVPAIKFNCGLITNLGSKPRMAPFVEKFTHSESGKTIYFIAARHAKGIQSDTHKMVLDAFNEFSPEFLIIEANISTCHGISSPQFVAMVKDLMSRPEIVDEAAYAASLATERNVGFIGGEPSFRQELEYMEENGYSKKDLIAFYALRQIAAKQNIDLNNFEESFSAYVSRPVFSGIQKEDKPTASEFIAWFNEHNTDPKRTLKNINTQHLAPNFPDYFGKLCETSSMVRNMNLLKQIEGSLEKYNKVLVVYGSGHLFSLENALIDAFTLKQQRNL